MTRALAVARHDGLLWAVVTADGVPTDLYAEKSTAPDRTGAVVRARVMRCLPGQRAAIVTWGDGQDGYWVDAGKAQAGDWVTLQIKSDAWADKLPQLAADIALPGRFMIHLPLGHGVKASRRAQGAVPLPEGLPGGWVVRRHAAQAAVEQLHHEAQFLAQLAQWFPVGAQGAVALTCPVWQRALIEQGATLVRIDVADAHLARQMRDWLTGFAPELGACVRMKADTVDFDDLRARVCRPMVELPQGARLTIEATRGFWACDVDTGSMQNPLQANILAARELARQLRLRNLGGMIVVDFISLRRTAERQQLLAALRAAVADDPAGVEVFGVTRLGLIEMTRRRRGPSLMELCRD